MDINILKIASDTKNNKHIHNCTHSMKYKSQICGDEIEIFLIIKDNVIKDFSYQSQSCIYCNASANLATKNFKKKSKEKIKNFLKLLDQFNDKTILFSGDRHRAGIYRKNGIIEVTSSSMNKPGSFFNETDNYLIGKTYPQENYSVLEIFENTIIVNIKDVNGNNLDTVVHKYYK